MPLSETMGAMEEAVDKGKTRYIGLSNFSLKQIMEAQEALRKYEIVSVQLEYNLMNRKVEKDILPYCERNGIAFMAYYPLAHGALLKKKDKLKNLCEKYNKTLAQVALNWLASKEKVFPIPRASNPYHVKENLGASGWRLSEEDIKKLEELFPLT
ncbi:Glyoxal reductase [archaeon HR06]|nr:Glyoxal reductase [archaeon HR06]